MKGAETRNRIFQATMRVAARDGLQSVTLDKVAKEAGLSKGGVMHHCPSKEALLSGVVEYFAQSIDTTLTRMVAEDPLPSHRWIRAMVKLYRQSPEITGAPDAHDPSESAPRLEGFLLSVIAAAVHNPELLKPVQVIGRRLRKRLTAVPGEGLEQLMLWLVMDGLFLWQFVGLLEADDPLIDDIVHAIEDRITQPAAGTIGESSAISSADQLQHSTRSRPCGSAAAKHKQAGQQLCDEGAG